MKFQKIIESKINMDIKYLSIEVEVCPGEVPTCFPFLFGRMWRPVIDIDSGQICNFPVQSEPVKLYIKARDNAIYRLYDENLECLHRYQDYVPHGLVPGEYGDYIELSIDRQGLILNWPENPSVDQLFNLSDYRFHYITSGILGYGLYTDFGRY